MSFSFDASELGIVEIKSVDFGDGQSVPAHQHPKGGGWVAETAHVDETCYVGPYAVVYGNAQITGSAIINDYAKVYGDAKVYGNAKVYGDAQVFDTAQVYGNARVSGKAKIYENSRVMDNAIVYDNAQVYGHGIVRNNAEVLNDAKIHGAGDIYDSIKIYDNSIVTRKPKACYGFDYNVTVTDNLVCLGCVTFPPKFIDTTGKKVVRLMGYKPDVVEKWITCLKFIVEFHECVDLEEDLENFDERKVILDLLNAKVGLK